MNIDSLSCLKTDITDIEEVAIAEAEIHNRETDFLIAVDPASVKITKRHLNLIVKEIIENSIKNSKPKSAIEIRGIKNESYYELAIKDYGNGIKQEIIESIDAFVQFSARPFLQNGIGLAMVKRLCDIYDCKFSIESKINEYTVVKIQIKYSN